ncbi:MAG: methyltransferase domain-containing protein [Nitrospina sp.]|nr:methyltransferase domain-containing protein [Nitrospina sp.]
MTPTPPAPDYEKKIIESFSRHVSSYERHAQLQRSMAERLATFLPPALPEPVLEIGCGTGLFTRHLLAHGTGKLILNDIAPAMTDSLRDHHVLPDGCQVEVGNAETLKFPEVGLIAGNAVFQWFREPAKTLRHFSKILKKDGFLLFNTFGSKTLGEFRETGSLGSPNLLLTAEDWEGFLEDSGFKILRQEVEERQMFFRNTRDLLRNLQQIGAAPFQLMKPGDLRSLIKNYDREFQTPQGVYTHWELFYFLAQK